jgi:hypothetical protein
VSPQDLRRTAEEWPAHRAKRKRRQARKRATKGAQQDIKRGHLR